MIHEIFDEPKYVLNGRCLTTSPKIVVETNECEFEIGIPNHSQGINRLLNRLPSGVSESELRTICLEAESDGARQLFDALKGNGLLRVRTPAMGKSGLEVLLELEDLSNQLLYSTLYKNVFWKKCTEAKNGGDIPQNVIYGMIIENYHFLFRESYFDAPVLSYVPNNGVRLAMNEFYAEEYGHDELLLKSLNQIGISRSDLAHTAPLPETMALCNGLAYWAHNDPLFFFTTLGILEGKDIRQDSFLDAAYRIGVDPELLKPVKAHSDINLKGEHGSLTRKIFTTIPIVCEQDIRRMKAQTYLFVELYDQFYTAIWNHYSQASHLLRRVDQSIEGNT
jgi:hypothetical protein